MNVARRLLVRAFQDERSKVFVFVNLLVSAAIIVSVTTVILETVPAIAAEHSGFFYVLEAFFFSFFLIEYLLRIYTAPDKWEYIKSPLGILDLICIVPGLVLLGPLFKDFGVLWVFRLLRILRLLRTIRLIRFVAPSEKARGKIAQALARVQWVNISIYLFAFLLVIVFSATLMFMTEGHLPGSEFSTIPDGMWWAVVTVTTVGYGDIVPLTTVGKFVAALTMMAGLALFAIMLVVVGQTVQKALFGSEVQK